MPTCRRSGWPTISGLGLGAAVRPREAGSGHFPGRLRAPGVAPGEAVYVGDDLLLDVEGAGRAGMRAVWMNRTASRRHRKRACSRTPSSATSTNCSTGWSASTLESAQQDGQGEARRRRQYARTARSRYAAMAVLLSARSPQGADEGA
ncbi:HAD hydrolase-like protein [Massilia sp. Se16.2.3]|uniref:HAD family hydrolase n=1 Tax=Massilia sp. Se16.2.3 TaxID=2709303 RepID=UPI0028064F26|nr:HAD hydrolase-like protein [Massilia sp. Se16.2.3]